jgi:hypothetical protein
MSAAKPKLRILVANEPRSYREAIADALQELRPNIEVVVLEPEALEPELRRPTPQLVTCSRLTPAVEDIALAWVQLYPEQETMARVSIGGRRVVV